MYYLTDICFLCLKNSIKLQSVFIQDNDGIDFNEKLRCCFPEKINSTPDAHKLACTECLEKLRFLYDFKKSVIRNNTVVNNYLGKLQYENKTRQQPSVVLATRKRRRKVSPTDNFSEIKVENVGNSFKLKIKNLNLNSTNDELLNNIDHSCQSTANKNVSLFTKYKCLTEEKDLETKNVEKVVSVTEIGTICVKQESQFSELNLASTNAEQLNTVDHSFQTTENGLLTKYNCLTEEKNLETKNVKKVIPVTETGTIYVKQESQFSEDDTTTNSLDKEVKDSKDAETIFIKQEPQFSENDSTTSYLDKEVDDSEGSNSSNEDDQNFEMSEEGTSRPNDHNKQKVNSILNSLKPFYMSDDSTKFCNTCQELLFKDLNNINLHLYTHIQSSNCSRCEDSLEEINKFQRHMFNHCETMFEILDKGDHGEKFSCALCDQQFDEFSNLKNHIVDKHIRSLKCVVCSRDFTHKPNLLRHILMTHCQVKLFKCKICPTRFVCKEGIKDHMIFQHYSGKVCICKFCQQTFRNPKALREHISRFHEENLRIDEDDSSKKDYTDDRLSCAVCQKQFNDLDNLKKHLYDNHVSTLDCEICSKSFSRRTGTFRHILETHCRVKIYNCIICAKKFTFKQSFEDHMISEHNNSNSSVETKPENKVIITENAKEFSCGICGRLYDDYKRFKKHIYAKHMPNLDCVICSGSYTRRITLHRHILEHHCDVKLLKCIICSLQFTDEESFKNHMIHQHNGGNTITEPENNIFPIIVLNKEKLSCAVCNKQSDSFESLKRHIYDDHITGLDCVVCSKTCSRREYLNRHILEQHCQLKLINCKLCSQRFGCKESFKDHMIQQHSSGKIGAVTDLDNKIGAVKEIDNKIGAFTELNKKVGAVTELDNKLGAVTELDNKVGAITELNNKIGAVTELDNKVGAVIEPEEVFIKDEPHYSDDYYSSDEEFEADNYEIGKDFSNFAMAEESNSRTSNSSYFQESVGSSVIPNTTATTSASYCEPGAPIDQSDVCEICRKMFLYLSNLSEHLNTHMQESNCSMCKDSAENISRLQRHMLTPCGNTNTPPDRANTANTRINDKVTCVVCQQEFKFNILKKHLYTHITNFTCVVCNLTITNKQNLRRHLLHHCNLKPLQCEVCGKSFSVKASLKYHVENAHSADVIACQYCKTVLKNTRSLQNHIKKLHPQNTYRCEVCKKIFIHKNELEKHAKHHTFS